MQPLLPANLRDWMPAHHIVHFILVAVADRCGKAGVPCDVLHRTGGLLDNIVEEEKRTELVVLGQRGEHARWLGPLMGSSVENVVRRSIKPCLVTPGTFHEIRNILTAYDGSDHSSKSLLVAIELAQSLGLAMTILCVAPSEPESAAAELLADAMRTAKDHGLDARGVTRVGHPEKEILGFAQREKMDLIVMGAYGHTCIREFVLGSTTSHVIRKSDVPVLLTR